MEYFYSFCNDNQFNSENENENLILDTFLYDSIVFYSIIPTNLVCNKQVENIFTYTMNLYQNCFNMNFDLNYNLKDNDFKLEFNVNFENYVV